MLVQEPILLQVLLPTKLTPIQILTAHQMFNQSTLNDHQMSSKLSQANQFPTLGEFHNLKGQQQDKSCQKMTDFRRII